MPKVFLVVFPLALVFSIQFVVGQVEKAFDEVASPEADRVLLSSREATSPESEVEAPTGFFDVFKRRMV
ncbi:hypothetical protein GOBAR_DD22373 [Gossypium barbadense]|nr:hypothetical protein GOBAR_DD22373 [Gossypium barbadense]